MMKAIRLFQILLFFFLTAFCTPVLAQKWEKKVAKGIEKSEKKYVSGDYQKAYKKIQKLEKKARKKLGNVHPSIADVLLTKSKYVDALGLLPEIEGPIVEALMINDSVNTGDIGGYAFTLKDGAAAFASAGYYKQGRECIEEAIRIMDSAEVMTDELRAEMYTLKARILVGQGFYRQAVNLTNGLDDYFKQLILAGGKRGPDKPKQDYAELMIVRANAYRKMGNYLSSDSAFTRTERWIDDQLSKKDLTYAKNQFYLAKLLQENGLAIDPLADMLQDSYVKGSKQIAPSHKMLMEIRTELMRAFYLNNQKGKFNRVYSEFNKTLKKYFPKESYYQITEDLFELELQLINEEIADLENNLNNIMVLPAIPRQHRIMIELLEMANYLGLLTDSRENTVGYQNQVLKIKEKLHGEESPEYHFTKLRLANYYIDYTDNFKEAEEIYENSFHNIVKPEISDGHIEYLEMLNHLAIYYQETDQYDRAEETLKLALETARKKYDDQDIEFGKELEKVARLQIKIGSYDEADKNLRQAKEIYDEIDTDVSMAYYSVALITEAKLMAIRGEYDEAEENIFESDEILAKGAALTVETAGLDYIDDLAGLYISLGRLSEAEELLQKSIRDKTEQFGESSRKLNEALVLSGKLVLIKGDYTEAESFARKANNQAVGTFGDASTKIVPSANLLADIYSALGDYDKASDLLKKSIEIQKEQFGNKHVDVGKTTSQLALVEFYRGSDKRTVYALFGQAEQIIGQELGSTNPTYAEILKNLAIASIAYGDYNEAFSYLDESGKIWKSKVGKRNNINAATISVLKGDIFYRQERFRRAENQYKDAQKLYEKFFSDKHPEYVKVISKLGKNHYMKGEWKKSQDLMETVLANYKEFITDYFPALSEREKAKFWNTIKFDYEFYNTLIMSKNRNSKYLGEMFNNALLTKALLLSSSIKIRQAIMNSNDQVLIDLYNQWIEKKELLTAALSMSTKQLDENNINPTQLSNEVESIEKDLSLKSDVFGQGVGTRVVTWENVKESLAENEAAIEMVRFRVFDKNFTDSIVYAMIYVTGHRRSKPEVIMLQNGKDLESKYLKFYRNSIKYKVADRYSYENYWKPMVDELADYTKLYISPDGVFNQINLEAIPTPDGRYVLDNSNIVLVSNTKDIFLAKTSTPRVTSAQNATMFGNPTFYLETSPGVPLPYSGLTRETAEIISQLPGTKRELEELKDYLDRKGWEINDFTETEASEEAIKQVSNPRIFHVATHGFFQSTKLEASADAELNSNYAYENPLLKSGLLLSGAGDILNETKFNYNIDNGILTAYEAMNLNLDQTDLVVLSACETGLGELEAGEGVYGLQRSFLVAGAKNIVMSLFKVSDEATQQLMVKFYRKWIETGNKRQAFIDAKKEIRNEFRDPIYWGPFVMIGMD